MKSQEKTSARPSLKVKGVDVLGYGTIRYSKGLFLLACTGFRKRAGSPTNLI